MKIQHLVLPLALVAPFDSLALEESKPVIWRLNAGVNYFSLRHHEKINDPIPSFGDFEAGSVLGLAVEQKLNNTSAWGSKLEFQRLDDSLLTSFRALDYKYRLNQDWRFGAFIGAANYDFRTAAFGYTAGIGAFYRPANWHNWGISIEGQYVDKLARDKLHPDDVRGENVGPDSFIDIRGVVFSITYEF